MGPVAGGIMGCFLVLALGVYCYRHHVHGNSHQYISSLPDQPAIRMSNFDGKPDEDEPSDEATPSGKLLFSTWTSEFVLVICRKDLHENL